MKKTYFKGNRSGNYVQVKLDTDKLEDIQSALMAKFVTRVGILGSKTDRHNTITTKQGLHKAGKVSSPKTNAEIGLLHEKGSLTQRIPRRSFLELPLVLKSEGLMAIRNKIWAAFIAGEQGILRQIPGSYTWAIAAKDRKDVIVLRDSFGIKPGVLGEKNGKKE